ncbi:serine hydrolase domain-containing protein [Spongiimicrobium sp. 2-473A-2-J]|uniref:serine hydrolase domain-containing protein n=1 Tax=Eudoraea algarum TaxID=3417568 RepID=UPI003D364416
MNKLLLALFWVSLASGHLCAQDATVKQEISTYLEGLDPTTFMGTVLVAKGDTVIFSESYGNASWEHNIKNSSETKYLIGSITKSHTALAIAILADQGKLGFDDPICNYLQDCPNAWKPITIHQLLNHTSGIVDLIRTQGFFQTITLPTTLENSLKRIRDLPLNFEPGTRFEYGNSGYLIAAYIIENTTGMPYDEFLGKAIYGPLEMRDSGYASTGLVLENRAWGYQVKNGKFLRAQYMDMSIPIGAGSQYATANDLLILNRALNSPGKLLSEKTAKKVFDGGEFGYGYGFYIEEFKGKKVIQHMGDIFGFGSYLSYIPEEDLFVCVLSNVQGAPVREIKEKLVQMTLDR